MRESVSICDARRAAPLDHEQDLVVTCDMWLQALAALATWDDGVDGAFIGARRPGGRGGDGPMLHNTNYSRPRPEPHTRCSPVAPTPFPPVTACALKFVDNLLAYPKGTIFCCWRSVCRVREMIAFLKYLKHPNPRSAVDSSE